MEEKTITITVKEYENIISISEQRRLIIYQTIKSIENLKTIGIDLNSIKNIKDVTGVASSIMFNNDKQMKIKEIFKFLTPEYIENIKNLAKD